ncbi:MAG TPA: MarR family transcriptional regulator [Nocardioides sp.]|nr:MarR family transcriptional regulator [Nocardioides sp.]
MEAIEEFRYLVLAAQREGARALAAGLKQHDLTPSQAEAIAVLRDAQRSLTVREIGDRLVCEGGSPSRLISTLARKGLVSLSADATDGRATQVALTPAGADAAAAVARTERDLYAFLATVIDDEQLEAAADALRGLVADLPTGMALQRRIDDKTSAR